jgi:hypothetical protein
MSSVCSMQGEVLEAGPPEEDKMGTQETFWSAKDQPLSSGRERAVYSFNRVIQGTRQSCLCRRCRCWNSNKALER